MGQDGQEWSWVGEDGHEHAANETELSLALSSEDLPPYTLVHKQGWGEWLPAMQVAELLWALPAGRSDTPKTPTMGNRPKPPLSRYPSLKKRARDIARGLIDPATESSLNLPAIQAPKPKLPPRPSPRRQQSSQPERRQHASRAEHLPFSAADLDEPTLQLDVDALDDELGQLADSSPPSAPHFTDDDAAIHTEIREQLPSHPSLSSPPVPEVREQLPSHPSLSRPPPPAVSSKASPPPPPPAMNPARSPAPPFGVGTPPTASPAPVAVEPVRPGSAPALSPLAQDPLPPPAELRGKPKWPIVAGVLAGLLVAGLVLVFSDEEPEPAPAPLATSAPPLRPEAPPKPLCNISTTPIAIAGWAHVGVRPILDTAPGQNRVAVGYAQTSKLAVGLILDVKTLNAEKPFSTYQNSPLLSVVPATSAMGQQLSFLESRAASTLQSAVFVPARTPFAIGHNGEGVAVRREGEGDDVLWKPQWETINVPTTARLDAETHIVVLRAGGERGSILMAKMTEAGHPKGELQELAPGTTGLGLPTVSVANNRVVVTFDGKKRGEAEESLYLASWQKSELAGKAKPVLSFADTVESVGGVALPDGAHLIQYTLGELTKQKVFAQVLDAKNEKQSDPILVSPPDKDAYNGELYLSGNDAIITYMVRSGTNHELWATRLSCGAE